MTPAEVARLKQDPYATGQVAPGVGLTLGAEQLGQQFETARNDYRAAVAKLRTYGLRQRQADPSGYEAARLAEAQTKQRLDAAQKTYETAAEPTTRPTWTDPNFLGQRAAASARARAGLAVPAAPAAAAPAPAAPAPAAPAAAAPAAPAAAAPVQPTKRAQSYDNKVTPYDAIIQQSAVENGIDPVVFKRLIGTESSFNPTAVSPRGAKFGLGIAQIAAVHKLSREQMLDPNTAIPFAAQLLAKEIRNTGGNIEEALMRYKGATSPGGQAAMSKPIGDILSGLTLTAAAAPKAFTPAATPAKTADAVAKAATYGMMYGSGTANASAGNPQIQQVLTERQALVRQIQLMEQYGFGSQAMQLVPQVRAIDLGLYRAQADQGIYEGTTTGNFSRAMTVLSNFRGQPHQSLDRGDGTHDLYVGGKLTRVGMNSEAMADFLRSNIDPEYQKRKAALAEKTAERQAKIEEIVVEKVLAAKGDTCRWQRSTAMGKIAEELEKRKGVKATHNTNNNTILVQETDNAGNARVFLVDPTGTKTEMRGKVVESPLRTQIYGPR
jgi:soluble lytic murein transglycosylase-like protein